MFFLSKFFHVFVVTITSCKNVVTPWAKSALTDFIRKSTRNLVQKTKSHPPSPIQSRSSVLYVILLSYINIAEGGVGDTLCCITRWTVISCRGNISQLLLQLFVALEILGVSQGKRLKEKAYPFAHHIVVSHPNYCTTVTFVVSLVISSGFLKRMVLDIWTVFEGAQDRKPAPPRIKHVDSIDSRTYNKVWLSQHDSLDMSWIQHCFVGLKGLVFLPPYCSPWTICWAFYQRFLLYTRFSQTLTAHPPLVQRSRKPWQIEKLSLLLSVLWWVEHFTFWIQGGEW